jgi:nucleoside phosphorylase
VLTEPKPAEIMADLTDSFSSDSRWHDLAGLIETENLSRAFYESTNNSVNGTTVATSFTPPELDVCGDLSADPGARSKNTHSVRYQCSQLNCRSTFARPSDRDRHVRSFHTLRVFSCPESHCERNTEHGGRGFSRHDKLIEHLRSVHSDRVHIAKSKATETLKGLMSSTESATDERDFEPELQEALRDTGKKRKLDFKKVESEIQDTSILTKAHDEYTIGWICLTTTAFVASQAFLDEEHGSPAYMFANDINCYKLGRIGGHYVVIANSPLNEYGTPGAIAIDNLMRAFPKIRATLMVDIGGGAPSRKHDIRLGDIIVGIAQDMDGGVVQYDFGKTTQDETFRQTRYTAQPPRILRTAMNGLRAQYERKGHRLEEAINKILKQNPKLQKRYKRPDRSYDRLFRSDYIHPTSSGSTCAEVCSADPSNLILRQERDIDDDSPTIHYGLIASANQVMRDALIRDKLVVEKDVLCFEMAAAGLSNRVSCLVIRGVCDYADSHKDTMWQGYAAMAATAYTKDLLHEIPPTRMKAEKALRGTLFG